MTASPSPRQRNYQLPHPVAYFDGLLDDLAVYNRVLTSEEVTYLYDLRMGREQTPGLEAIVDAVGVVEVNEGGEGYRENPDLIFETIVEVIIAVNFQYWNQIVRRITQQTEPMHMWRKIIQSILFI